VASHLSWLLESHCLEDRGCDVAEDTVFLLEAPSFRCVGHDEGDFVGGVRGLWLAVFELHFFGVTSRCQCLHKCVIFKREIYP